MRRYIFRLLLLTLLPVSALAQGGAPVLESLEVDVWPEYDRPAALVMYQFRVSPTTSLDTPVPIPIPASVGEPHAVAWRDVQGKLLLADYVRRVEGDRAIIMARLGSYEGQLEFYSDIEFDEKARRFSFRWPGGVSVGSLTLDIQEPSGASGLAVVPEPARRSVGGDGLNYAHLDLGSLDEAATPTIEVRYEKDSDRLTQRNPTSSAPNASGGSETAGGTGEGAAATATATGSSNAVLFAVAGILFGAGAAWLGWSYLSTRQAQPEPVSAPSRASSAKGSASPSRTDSGDGDAAPFCHECGAKTRPEAAFCMECGTKLMKKPV